MLRRLDPARVVEVLRGPIGRGAAAVAVGFLHSYAAPGHEEEAAAAIATPVVDLIEIGAGGGSIARIDELGPLKVGPRSAGADPGPACYGLGGTDATVTDANLLLGFLNAGSFLGGRMRLDRAAAEAALARLGAALGLVPLATAWGMHRIANEAMAAAARIHAIERNRDPRAFSLLAFDGVGPAHAGGSPRCSGSARSSGRRAPGWRPRSAAWSRPRLGVVRRGASAAGSAGSAGSIGSGSAASWPVWSGRDGRRWRRPVAPEEVLIERSVELRLAGQYHELPLPLPPPPRYSPHE